MEWGMRGREEIDNKDPKFKRFKISLCQEIKKSFFRLITCELRRLETLLLLLAGVRWLRENLLALLAAEPPAPPRPFVLSSSS